MLVMAAARIKTVRLVNGWIKGSPSVTTLSPTTAQLTQMKRFWKVMDVDINVLGWERNNPSQDRHTRTEARFACALLATEEEEP